MCIDLDTTMFFKSVEIQMDCINSWKMTFNWYIFELSLRIVQAMHNFQKENYDYTFNCIRVCLKMAFQNWFLLLEKFRTTNACR